MPGFFLKNRVGKSATEPMLLERNTKFVKRGLAHEDLDRRAAVPAVPPPSQLKVWPFTKADSSDARYKTRAAISSGLPTRGDGRVRSTAALRSGAFCRSCSVAITPGAMQFVRTFWRPYC